MTTYSIHDLQTARAIINDNTICKVTGQPIFTAEFVEWAETVITWFNKLWTLLSKYAKRLRSAALAMKAIWQNIRKGFSIERMLHTIAENVLVVAEGVTGKQLRRGNFKGKDTYTMPTMKSRAGKFAKHSYNRRWAAHSVSNNMSSAQVMHRDLVKTLKNA